MSPELDLIWVLVPIGLMILLFGAYRLGIVVGEDHADLEQFRKGREFGHAEVLDAIEMAPPMFDMLDEAMKGPFYCKCHGHPFEDPFDRAAHEQYIDSIGGVEAERFGEAPW